MNRTSELSPPGSSLPEHSNPARPATTELSRAAEMLWGPAGAYLYAAYARIQVTHFPDLPAEIPLVIGLTAFGHCIGLTRQWPQTARISIAPGVFARGEREVDDVLFHEMLHVHLLQAGLDPKHASEPWYAGVRRLSRAVLRWELDVERHRRRSVRIPNPNYGPDDKRKTLVRKANPAGVGAVRDGVVSAHRQVAGWPQMFRPEDYDWGAPVTVPTY